MTNRMTELLAYLDRLIALRSVDYHCIDEIDDCIAMIVEELGDKEGEYGSGDISVNIDKEEYREIDRQVDDSMARLLSKDKR